jgi:hypothetical protein
MGFGIRDPRSGKKIFRIPDAGVKKAPDPGSWIRIRRIRMFLGLLDPDPDPLVRDMDPDPSITKQKIVRKTPWLLLLCDFFGFLSLKNDVNVPSKSTY